MHFKRNFSNFRIVKIRRLFALFLALSGLNSYAHNGHHEPGDPVVPHVSPALRFTENLGQWDSKIRYRARLDGGALYLENDGLTFDFYDKKKLRKMHAGGITKAEDMFLKAHAFKVEFVDCNKNSVKEASDKGEDYENFYIGNDHSKWKTNVRNYHKVWYRNLYEGIDYEVITAISGIKYNFYLKAGAKPEQIKLKYIGVDKVSIKDGTLKIKLSINEVIEQKPYAYQRINGKIVEVPCKYKLDGNELGFDLPKGYNPNYELVIDPVLVFAAQSGSTADNFGMTATYDAAGNLYAGGTVFDNGYPTVSAYTISFSGPAGGTDVVLTKYNSVGTALIYSTYLGGNGSEIVTSLIVDPTDNLVLYGATGSSNFPMPSGSTYDNTYNGGVPLSFVFNGTNFTSGTDIYVTKFNSTGTTLLGSTYIGGSDNDGVNHTNAIVNYTAQLCGGPYPLTEYKPDSLQYNYGDQYRGEIQLDKAGNVYIASSTRSSNFPTLGPFDATLGGKQDAVIVKFNPNLTSLIYSSYLGGSQNDAGYSLIVTDSNFVYMSGGTYSTDFPTKPGCYQMAYNGGKADGYIVKINAAGNTILKGTYIGTNNYDQTYFVQSDRIGNIYVYGQSLGNMPVIGSVYSNPNSHQFISRLDRQLSNINLATVFGSGQNKLDISPSAFSVDKCSGTINLSGWGGNFIFCSPLNGMPVTSGAFQSVPPNNFDFYLFSLYPNASGLKYASYFGGNLSQEHVDGGTSRFSDNGQLYQSVCAGCGGNDDFPVTAGAWPGTPNNPNHATNCNNGVFKFDFQPKVTATIGTNTITGCQPVTITFTNLSSPGLEYHWNLGEGAGDTTSTVLNPIKTYTAPGTYTVKLVVIENLYCNTKDSTTTVITVYPKIDAGFNFTVVPCSDSVKFVNTSTTTASSYNSGWTFVNGGGTSGVNNPIMTFTASGTYTANLIVTTVNGCTSTVSQPFTLNVFNPAVSPNFTICYGDAGPINLTASGGTSYSWQPAGSVSNPNISNPNATPTPTATTVYSVIVTSTVGITCVQTLTTEIKVNPKPNADFTFSVNPCGGSVDFKDGSATNIVQRWWDFSGQDTASIANPFMFYSTGGTYTVNLIVKNIWGCYDTVNKPLVVGQPDPVSISPSRTICLGSGVQLIATGGDFYYWENPFSVSNPNVSNPYASPTTNTSYTVTIYKLKSNGDTCKYKLKTSVFVSTLSAIALSVTAVPDTVELGQSTTLTLYGDPGLLISWSPTVVTQNSYTTLAFPDKPTTYTVTVKRGVCVQSLTVDVFVYKPGCDGDDVYIPNTFTPNGDGKNDIMYARCNKTSELYFAIYNRWGELVFDTKDKNVGWDGTYKGRPADVGVFGYYVRFKCFNGEESFRKGNITLIR